MAKQKRLKDLSAYSKPENCTDLNDATLGLMELTNFVRSAKKPCKTAYMRINKFNQKIEQWNREHNQIS